MIMRDYTRLLTSGLFVGLMLLLTVMPATAQDEDWCDDAKGWYSDNDGERFCEVREYTLDDRNKVAVDGGNNGGISIEGWDRNEILVRAKVQGFARSEARAQALAEDVEVKTNGTIRADVPDTKRKEWVSVSYRVYVPHDSNLDLEAHNGGISIKEVEGDIRFETLNGGVSLKDLAGDVTGRTTNGGLSIELEGNRWDGEGLNVQTTNGGVKMKIPEDYSANLESKTTNGGIHIDFPVTVKGRINRRIKTQLGDGGPMIRAITTNGGVHIKRM